MRQAMLDRYLLDSMARPIAICLTITLVALLLERILRIINDLAENGAHFGFVVQLTLNLVPHYLSLALPASFFISIFIVVARLSDGNEIDALLASGVSIGRMAAPFIGVGLAFMLISLVLFGFLQPYGRYGYHAVLNAAIHAGWNAQLQPEVFVDPGQGFTITADRVGMSGRDLKGVFVRRVSPDGREQITTAKSGALGVSPDGRTVSLRVDEGQQLDRRKGEAARVLQFRNISGERSLQDAAAPMRPRGGDVRELTLFELTHELRLPNPAISKSALAGELYGRLARSLSVPFLPLLAIPLGMASKRGRRAPGLIIAGVMLVSFHHAVQMSQSLSQAGRVSPAQAVGSVYVVFVGLCLWLFLTSLKRPGDTPITRAVGAVSVGVGWLRRPFEAEPAGVTP